MHRFPTRSTDDREGGNPIGTDTIECDGVRIGIQKAIDDHTSEIQELRSAAGAKDNMISCLEKIKTEHGILSNKMQNEVDDLLLNYWSSDPLLPPRRQSSINNSSLVRNCQVITTVLEM